VRICILSRNPAHVSTRRLVESAEKRGHSVLVIDYLRCVLELQSGKPRVLYAGAPLQGFDIVLPRVASGPDAAYGATVVRQFEVAGTRCVNSSLGINRAGDKLRSLQLLSRAGLAVPRTGFAHTGADKDLLIEQVGGPPVILKLLQGTQGSGVLLANTRKSAENQIAAFQQVGANFLVQEFIAEAGGKDIRALVVGGKVVAAMQRSAPEGDFRSNIHRGGTARALKLSAAQARLATRAAKAIGLEVAGVDMIRARRGLLLLEVNASPGLEGIEGATKIDVAGAIVTHMERMARARRKHVEA
jgi:ribosomal protein S6--L-glutamate ligase